MGSSRDGHEDEAAGDGGKGNGWEAEVQNPQLGLPEVQEEDRASRACAVDVDVAAAAADVAAAAGVVGTAVHDAEADVGAVADAAWDGWEWSQSELKV